MKEFLEELFSSDFMPHGYCYLWKPGLVWLHVVSDALIALAYFMQQKDSHLGESSFYALGKSNCRPLLPMEEVSFLGSRNREKF
jgi:hypothetical protein